MFSWLSMLFSESPGEPSIRRIVFFLAFALGAAVAGLGMAGHEISPAAKDLTATIVVSAFGAMGLGRIAEAWEDRQ